MERLAALASLIAAGVFLAGALPLPRGVAARPGPGFYPLLVGVFFCATAAGFLVETIRRRTVVAPVAGDARTRVLVTAAALVGFVLLLPWIGYPAATFLFVAGMLRALGASWLLSLATAVAAAAGSYYLFASILSVPLPRGVFLD
jgi:hypothetical protein